MQKSVGGEEGDESSRTAKPWRGAAAGGRVTESRSRVSDSER